MAKYSNFDQNVDQSIDQNIHQTLPIYSLKSVMRRINRKCLDQREEKRLCDDGFVIKDRMALWSKIEWHCDRREIQMLCVLRSKIERVYVIFVFCEKRRIQLENVYWDQGVYKTYIDIHKLVRRMCIEIKEFTKWMIHKLVTHKFVDKNGVNT